MKTVRLVQRPALPLVAATNLAAALLSACTATHDLTKGPSTASSPSAVESIHVVRSLRVERTMPSTWCTADRAGFAPLRGPSLLEDRFTLHSVASEPGTGVLRNTMQREVGELRTCFGNTADPLVFNFHAQGAVAGVAVTGDGQCAVVQPNHPEAGITALRCHLQLRDLPAPHVGGLLTSSTVSSKAVLGLETDPPGYLHSSIATIRLWREPLQGRR